MKFKKKLPALLLGVLALCAAFVLSACDEVATTSQSCAFIVGDGGQSGDANVHNVVYPGQRANQGNNESVVYIPCNSRNYIINASDNKNANGDAIGDYHTPIRAVTKDGTRVSMWLTVTWTPNQDKTVMMKNFYPFCEKYQCFSKNQDGKGNVNSAPVGWNNMLGENMPFAIGATAHQVLPTHSDAVWKTDSDWDKIATEMSEKFADNFRKQTGFGADLICGSGDVSHWDDPQKPGKGKFTCGQVRFVINSVVPTDPNQRKLVDQQTKAELEKKSNQSALEASRAKYGSNGGNWLGMQDTIAACNANAKCTVVLGKGSAVVGP